MRVHDVPYLCVLREMIVIVRIQIFSSRNFYHALSTHWHIGISCFLPRGMIIQLSVCSKCLPFVTALRPDRPTPSPSGWPNACGWATGGLPPALPALGPSAAPAAAPKAPPRPTSLASRDLVACPKTMLEAVQGRSSAAHRGLERNSFVASVLQDASSCFAAGAFRRTTALTGSLEEPTDAPH